MPTTLLYETLSSPLEDGNVTTTERLGAVNNTITLDYPPSISSSTPSPTGFHNEFLDPNVLLPTDAFDPSQEVILNWTGRIAAILSFLGGVYIFYNAWKRRDQVYHRLMLAMSVYIIVWSPWMIYGVAALPVGTNPSAHGSINTCTAQGFFNQLSTAIPSYYVALSCFSWIVIVYGNFDPSRYAWVEKYIHVFVNLCTVVPSLWLLGKEAYNPGIEGWPGCYIGSVPVGCGSNSGVECIRGPDNIQQLLGFFVGLPVSILLLVPTLLMPALACYLYIQSHHPQPQKESTDKGDTTIAIKDANAGSRNSSMKSGRNSSMKNGPLGVSRITAMAVIQQSAVYLGMLYFVYMPGILMIFFWDRKEFAISCLGTGITVSKGFWIALVYRYFSSKSSTGILGGARRRASKILDKARLRRTMPGFCSRAFSADSNSGHLSLTYPHPHFGRKDTKDDDDDDDDPVGCSVHTSQSSVMHKDEMMIQDENLTEPSCLEFQHDNGQPREESKKEEFRRSFKFNIFDGTAPTESQWSQFVFEGDDSDEEADLEESRYWAGCQGA